ncbi:MAG TPA: 16S rRNA (guanine(966)-N(2))-methyltransferase RsmD [Dehalococcoidia bacterium]|nr:16S rRNA (guanine(966)-N(2))-methyltransferase RsmD [Dehalococcoidia bacterium]
MRVIAGTVKGRRLKGPRDRSGRTRPSSDLVRGAVFSALASMRVDLARVLDLYAGSGALGIEALSRGAESCDFVERDASACSVIRENLDATGFAGVCKVYCMPVARVIDRLQGPYTLVLADPPYEDRDAISLLAGLASSDLVREGSILVLEHSAREEPSGELGKLSLVSVRRHGDSAVSIYR